MFHVRQWCLLYLLTFNKLTNSQEQCASRKANSFSTSHERSSILQDPKVHHLVHNSPPPEPVLSRINSVHAIHPILEYRFYYYLSPLRRGLPSGFLLLSFTTKTSHTPLLSPTRATCLAHLIPLYLITRLLFVEVYWSLCPPLCSRLNTDTVTKWGEHGWGGGRLLMNYICTLMCEKAVGGGGDGRLKFHVSFS